MGHPSRGAPFSFDFWIVGEDIVRGIEGALHVLARVREGRFASEALRDSGSAMAPGDLSLAASLVYIVLRREEMWQIGRAHV